jgi:hypothetical protein
MRGCIIMYFPPRQGGDPLGEDDAGTAVDKAVAAAEEAEEAAAAAAERAKAAVAKADAAKARADAEAAAAARAIVESPLTSLDRSQSPDLDSVPSFPGAPMRDGPVVVEPTGQHLELHQDDIDQFRTFLRSLLMHGAIGTAIGGCSTMVGDRARPFPGGSLAPRSYSL